MILVMTFLPLYIRELETHMGAVEISAGGGGRFFLSGRGTTTKNDSQRGMFLKYRVGRE